MTISIIGNGTLATAYSNANVTENGAVAYENGRVIATGTTDEMKKRYPAAEFIDARGGLILPGLVNCHHHYYSALARGLNPGFPTPNFPETLDKLWWRLDRALNKETVEISSDLTAIDCVKWGCTTVIDHHASPTYLKGSLDTMAQSLEKTGLRGVLCYEVTDRNGPKEAMDGIEENLRFIESRGQNNKTMRGMMGLHASFTLREETLKEVAKRTPAWAGVHIHVAEDKSDVEYSENIFGAGPVERLRRNGLLSERAIMAHCIHLTPAEYKIAASHKAILVHNAESNANNGVGRFDCYKAAEQGCFITLGTDGMSSNMLRSLRFAFLGHRGATMDSTSGWTVIPDLLHNNAIAARRFLDEPMLGEIKVGAPADIIVVDAQPPTPISGMNLTGHLIFGASEARVRHTIGQGKVLMRDYEVKIRDTAEVTARARQISPIMWKTFENTKGGTPLPR